MSKIVINGNFLSVRITGIGRYSIEMIKKLDKLCGGMDVELLMPNHVACDLALHNIKAVKYGNLKGALWNNICYPMYIIKKQGRGISFGFNTCLTKAYAITVIHDIRDIASKNYAGPFARFAMRLSFWHSSKFSKHIVTDSEFSKNEICRFFKTNPRKVSVIYCAWQHFSADTLDESCLERLNLTKYAFYFSLGQLTANKNLRWIYEMAQRHKKHTFVITGEECHPFPSGIDASKKTGNVIFTGRLSDDEIKALMKYSKAFLLPSFYEGFGLPPLEALAIGCKHIIISNTSSLPEIYGDSAHYIDPYDYEVDLDKLLEGPVAPASEVLGKYSWEKSAKQFYDLLKNVLNKEDG